jgi:hypothetical protein
MQGSLDQPPIVIRSSTLKSFSLMAGCALIAAFSWLEMSISPSSSHAASGFVAFGLAVPYYAWLLLSPNVLTLSPEGLELKTRWRKARWSWQEVSRFRVVPVHILSRHIGFDLAEAPAGSGSFMQYYVGYAGADDSLGGGWELDPAGLADLLNQAQTRWAPRSGRTL